MGALGGVPVRRAVGGVVSRTPAKDGSVPVLLSPGCTLLAPRGLRPSAALSLLNALAPAKEDQ